MNKLITTALTTLMLGFAGTALADDIGVDLTTPQLALKTRAQVVAELARVRARGELDALASEDSGSAHLVRMRRASVDVSTRSVTAVASVGGVAAQ